MSQEENSIKSKKNPQTLIVGNILLIIGVIITVILYSSITKGEAAGTTKTIYSLAIIAVVIGIITTLSGLKKVIFKTDEQTKPVDIKMLTQAALFAALAYVAFTFLRIDMPLPGGSSAFHLGNVFVVLAALILGGYWGGLAGAVGLSIADLTNAIYVTSTPKTFLLKLVIGLIVGLVAHRIAKLNENHSKKYVIGWTIGASATGMIFNIIADPLVGYFYKTYLLGIPQNLTATLAKLDILTTSVNAGMTILIASALYLAIRPVIMKNKA